MLHDKIPDALLNISRSTASLPVKVVALDLAEKVKKAHVFYAPLVEDTQLAITANDFLKEGVLNLPFDRCIIVEDGVREGMSGRIVLYAENVGHCWDVHVLVATHNGLHMSPIMMHYNPIGGYIDAEHIDASYKTISQDVAEQMGNAAIGSLSTALMLINMPQYEKLAFRTGQSGNSYATRKAKTPYTVIKLHKQYSSVDSKGGGWTVAPHWRRGHVRTLPTGKKVPVMPCMINWEGEALPPKTYVVEN